MRVEADSAQAQALLTDILASPRDDSAPRSKRQRRFGCDAGTGGHGGAWR
jgi:hypothetical protein